MKPRITRQDPSFLYIFIRPHFWMAIDWWVISNDDTGVLFVLAGKWNVSAQEVKVFSGEENVHTARNVAFGGGEMVRVSHCEMLYAINYGICTHWNGWRLAGWWVGDNNSTWQKANHLVSKVLIWAGIGSKLFSSAIQFYQQHQRLETYKERVCNGQFKVFLKIGIYSTASFQAKWEEGGSLGK